MKGSLAKLLSGSLILIGLACPAYAQKPNGGPVVIEGGKAPQAGVSAVSVAALPGVSPETIGVSENIKADMWAGTKRDMAERLLMSLTPSGSPVLNDLVVRLLRSVAVPPEGEAKNPKQLTSLRVEKLARFGDFSGALALAKRADAKLVDGGALSLAAEGALASGDEAICGQVAELAKGRSASAFQQLQILCRVKGKDIHAAQVALDVLQTDKDHDAGFVEIADRNILGGSKTVPAKIGTVSFASAALLQAVNLPLPDSFYGRANVGVARGLLRVPAQKDAAKIAFIETAAERGLVGVKDLADAYRAISFAPEVLASALTAAETGGRLRALLFQAAAGQTDPAAKIALTAKFVQSASPAFLNGAGGVLAAMLGDVEPSTALLDQAVFLARAYLLAQKDDVASGWISLIKSSPQAGSADYLALWPQLAVGGFETENDYEASLAKWFEAALKSATTEKAKSALVSTLLVMDADDMIIPESAWQSVLSFQQAEKGAGVSALLLERMRAAAANHRAAETVLFAVALAGEGEIPLQAAIGIISALRQVGLEADADLFARQTIAAIAREKQ